MCLLRRAIGFAVVARLAGRNYIHPSVDTALAIWNDVLTRKVFFVKMVAAVGADIAVAGKQFPVGQSWAQFKGVDIGHAFGANDAVDGDDGLLACDGVVAAMKYRDFAARFPAHFLCGVVDHSLL